MEEKKNTGRTYLSPDLKKEAVFIGKNGEVIEEPKREVGKKKTLEEFLEQRRRRMGR